MDLIWKSRLRLYPKREDFDCRSKGWSSPAEIGCFVARHHGIPSYPSSDHSRKADDVSNISNLSRGARWPFSTRTKIRTLQERSFCAQWPFLATICLSLPHRRHLRLVTRGKIRGRLHGDAFDKHAMRIVLRTVCCTTKRLRRFSSEVRRLNCLSFIS